MFGVLALFNSYMTNRTQQVQIGNALSNKCPLTYGVHEGSILGPLLFILYIHDRQQYQRPFLDLRV
jgi:hypothetical protein